MIRALNTHWGIPASVLIQPTSEKIKEPAPAALTQLRSFGVMKAREAFDSFLDRAFGPKGAPALLRKTRTSRTNAKTDASALQAWCAAVLVLSEAQVLPQRRPKTRKPSLKDGRNLARLSMFPDGPERVRGALAKLGIVLVVVDHLPGTFLDGAAMFRRSDQAPVIAITRRHDRLDNFWFTLLHEFMHVALHLGGDRTLIVDDLEVQGSEAFEEEADRCAREALVPNEIWARRNSEDFDLADLARTAREAGVHPAVVAGRWRYEHNDYRRFAKHIGRNEVRSREI